MINIKTDSRKVKKGDIFVALPGINSNGNEYIDKAIENGASTIVCETGEYKVETIHTDNPRNYLLNYLKEHYQSIMNKMMFVGITGTNGKTTSSFLLSELCNRLGKKSAYIGTIGFYIGNEKRRNLNNTTPDICDLYELFIEACEENCECIVLEVSSQGLSYGRLDGISFDVGVFTNLTQDHLDYHKTMENYALAKQKLFYNIKENGFALINSDDSYKDYYLLDGNKNITYGFFSGDYRVIDYEMTHLGMIFTYVHNDEEVAIKTNLTGKYNISNLLTSIIILEQIGYKSEEIKKEVLHLESPSGRMEMIPSRESLIVIDYAHTPDAMTKIISTMKEATKGNIYVIFGCTGSRDRSKRPIMANIATSMCKYAIFTSDDLHDEEFADIIKDMKEGLENTNYEVCMDREKAIYKGIELLKEKDILLILGKGHEEVMIIKDKKIPFHDRTVVEEYIKNHEYQECLNE